MSVPTHNLYDFVHQATKKQFYLMYFFPWGSRLLEHVRHYQTSETYLNGPNGISPNNRYTLGDWTVDHKRSSMIQPLIFCHDQEPLNFDLYCDGSPVMESFYNNSNIPEISSLKNPYTNNRNLRIIVPHALQKRWILLHSELNSPELLRYEATKEYIGAYWWSHAIISRDWYRFAEYDNSLQPNLPTKLFLVYCRDITGSREYRQTFLEMVQSSDLVNDCQTQSFNEIPVTGDASAIYNVEDFNNTAISVVLETVFDTRIHLTEKILRPIACGHPFILAAGPGSLDLLRKYGFKTFGEYINEDYDEIQDPSIRLQSIVAEMKRIQNLPKTQQDNLIEHLQKIAEFNRRRFFSKDFQDQIVQELQDNVSTAYNAHNGEISFDIWWQDRKWRRKNQPNKCRLPYYKDYLDPIVRLYRQHRLHHRLINPDQSGPGSESL